MPTGLLAKLALTTVAAMGLYVPTMGLPLPLNSCVRTAGVANAAPSPTCASDLRECLRASADMHPTTFGVRYVTADDVAKCTEAFNNCTKWGASKGGNTSPPSTSASAGGDDKKGLPQRFGIKDERGLSSDCRVEGDTVNCSLSFPRQDGIDVQTGTVIGKVNGLTVTGTGTYHVESHSLADASCTGTEDYSGPVSYVFSPTGTVKIQVGPNQARGTYNCNGRQNSNSWVTPGGSVESTGTWSPTG